MNAPLAQATEDLFRSGGPLFREKMAGESRLLAERLDIAFDGNPFRALETRFLVAATGARVGTHLLCQKLTDHGIYVNEFFNWAQLFGGARKANMTRLEDYIELALSRFTVDGVFGVKGEANILVPMVLAREFPQYSGDWKVVFLAREDLVMQAVSQLKAELTGAYVAASEPTRALTDADYDAERIAGIVAWNQTMTATWEEIFEAFDMTPLRLEYEDLAADPAAVAARAAQFIGLRGAPVPDRRPLMQRQADALNLRWAERFRAEHPLVG